MFFDRRSCYSMYDYGFGISNVDSLDYATPQLNVYLNLSSSRIDMLEEVSMIISVKCGLGRTSGILYWDNSVKVRLGIWYDLCYSTLGWYSKCNNRWLALTERLENREYDGESVAKFGMYQ